MTYPNLIPYGMAIAAWALTLVAWAIEYRRAIRERRLRHEAEERLTRLELESLPRVPRLALAAPERDAIRRALEARDETGLPSTSFRRFQP